MAKRIALKLDGTPTSVLEFGARNAFAWVDGLTLQRLWTRLGLPTPRPTAVLDLCAGLIKSVLPGSTDEELQLILQGRDLDTSAVNFDTQSELLKEDPENLNGVWGEDDEDDIRKDLKEAKAKAARASASRSSRSSSERASPPAAATEAQAPVAASSSASASSSSAALPSEGPPAKQRFALPLGASELRKEDLHLFLPPNCTLTAERVWHSRWRLRYVGSTGTQATSKTFGGAVTEADALRYLLTTAWRWHQQDGGASALGISTRPSSMLLSVSSAGYMQALGRRFKANGTRGQNAFAESSQTCCFAALLVWCRVLPRPEDPLDISRRVFQIRDRDTGGRISQACTRSYHR